MNFFTRISATLNGKVDEIVSHVENHDAVVAVALKDTRSALAKAKIRLDRVRRDGTKMQHRLAEAERMEELWAQRACQIADEDKDRALQCITRRNQCREQAAQTRDTLKRHAEVEKQVSESVARIEKRLTDIMQQQNLMRSRQSTAEALRVINKIEGHSDNNIEDTFDRWEMLITEAEYSSGSTPDIDDLDATFRKDENRAELMEELDALLRENTPSKK